MSRNHSRRGISIEHTHLGGFLGFLDGGETSGDLLWCACDGRTVCVGDSRRCLGTGLWALGSRLLTLLLPAHQWWGIARTAKRRAVRCLFLPSFEFLPTYHHHHQHQCSTRPIVITAGHVVLDAWSRVGYVLTLSLSTSTSSNDDPTFKQTKTSESKDDEVQNISSSTI